MGHRPHAPLEGEGFSIKSRFKMSNRHHPRARARLVLVGMALLAACGGDSGGGVTPPTPEPAVAQATVVGGSGHSCALSRTGVVSCWGRNDFGQLGRGAVSASISADATPVGGSLRFKALSANGYATCAITVADSRVYCWGMYRPSGTIIASPVAVLPELAFQSVSVGTRNVCALTTAGDAWCWGENTFYQLGLGPTATAASESGGRTFALLATGFRHACATQADGAAYCWGSNAQGQLGATPAESCQNGSCSSVPAPVTIWSND